MLQMAMTKIPVTPDQRGAVGFLPSPAPEAPRDDLFARLFLLRSGAEQTLVVSLDYGGLYLSVQEDWKKRLAAATGVPFERVILHCVHQHDAPFINLEAARMVAPEVDWSWLELIIVDLERAARALPERLTEIRRVGWSESRLQGYASNRRVPVEDGAIAVRYSRCGDSAIREKPTGIIDPMLRTLGFYDAADRLLATWSFYATHPQVANEGKRYSADAPGEAMRLLEQRNPGVTHAFFNGCFGNVTAGKYTSTDDLEGNLRRFGRLLADGIGRNLASQELAEVTTLSWRREAFAFPARQFDEAELEKRGQHSPLIRVTLLAGMEWAKTHREEFTMDLLTLGPVKVLFMDGELFIEYQLFCQGLIPDEKLGVAGNCGDDFYYIGTEAALRDPAGYETTGFCRVLPEFEGMFREAARKLLLKK